MYISERHADAANRTTRRALSTTGPLWSVVASGSAGSVAAAAILPAPYAEYGRVATHAQTYVPKCMAYVSVEVVRPCFHHYSPTATRELG